jgi:hypothetical protein
LIANSLTTKAGGRERDAGSQGHIVATPSTGDVSHCLNGGGHGPTRLRDGNSHIPRAHGRWL